MSDKYSPPPGQPFHDNIPLQLGACLLAALLLFFMQMKLKPELIVTAGLAPLLLIIVFRKPYIAAILLVAFSFFRIHEAYPFIKPLKLILLTSLLSLMMLIWHAFIARSIKPVWTRELTILLIFFLLVTIGIPFADNPQMALQFWSGSYVKIILMVPPIAWMIRSASDFNWTSRIIVSSGILIAARALYNKYYGIALVEGTRVTIGQSTAQSPLNTEEPLSSINFALSAPSTNGILSDPNDLALVLLFPLGFAMAYLVYRSGFINTLIGLLGASMISLGIIATQSRGGLLGMLAVFAIIGLRLIKSRLLLALLGAVAFVTLFFAMGIGDRSSGGFNELARAGGIDESSMGRIIAWKTAINMFIHHPLTGVGLDNFVNAFDANAVAWPVTATAVHSTWFGVLAETGAPGFITFVLMVIMTIRTAISDLTKISDSGAPNTVKAASLAQVSSLVSFCIAGTFLTQAFTLPLYILLALTVAVNQYVRAHQ